MPDISPLGKKGEGGWISGLYPGPNFRAGASLLYRTENPLVPLGKTLRKKFFSVHYFFSPHLSTELGTLIQSVLSGVLRHVVSR